MGFFSWLFGSAPQGLVGIKELTDVASVLRDLQRINFKPGTDDFNKFLNIVMSVEELKDALFRYREQRQVDDFAAGQFQQAQMQDYNYKNAQVAKQTMRDLGENELKNKKEIENLLGRLGTQITLFSVSNTSLANTVRKICGSFANRIAQEIGMNSERINAYKMQNSWF